MLARPPLPGPLRPVIRRLLRLWGLFPKAPAYHYQAVERWGARLAVSPIDARLFSGARVSCDLHDHVGRHMYFYGAYEPIEAYLFSALVRPGMVVVDAGANVGQYSLIAGAAVGSEGGVHAFEPVPMNFARLAAHVDDNGLRAIVRTNRAALWHQTETLTLRRDSGMWDNAGAFTVGTVSSVIDTWECDAVRLDDYVADARLHRLDLMKMDIEGAELFALQGGMASLARWRPTVLMEINRAMSRAIGYEPEAIWELLKPLGYRMWSIGSSSATSVALEDLSGVDRANVIFHARGLPDAVTRGWTLKGILRSHRWASGL